MGIHILKGFVALLGGEKSRGSESLVSLSRVSSPKSGGLARLNAMPLNLRRRRTTFSRLPSISKSPEIGVLGENALAYPYCIQMLPLRRDTIN